jgi:hypothetical protein
MLVPDVSMQIDSIFSSLFKIQVSRAKSYCNINKEVVPLPVRFVEYSLLKHRLRPGKAMPHFLLKCRSLRFGPHFSFHCRNMQNP